MSVKSTLATLFFVFLSIETCADASESLRPPSTADTAWMRAQKRELSKIAKDLRAGKKDALERLAKVLSGSTCSELLTKVFTGLHHPSETLLSHEDSQTINAVLIKEGRALLEAHIQNSMSPLGQSTDRRFEVTKMNGTFTYASNYFWQGTMTIAYLPHRTTEIFRIGLIIHRHGYEWKVVSKDNRN